MIERTVTGVISCFRGAIQRLAVTSAGCATTYSDHQAGSVEAGGAVQQPFRNVDLIKEIPPEIPQRATVEPYQLSPVSGCVEIVAEIASLGAVLEPDLDVPHVDGKDAGNYIIDLATDAVDGILSLRCGGDLRHVSSAERCERELAREW